MTPTLLQLTVFLAGVLVVLAIYNFVADLFLRDRARVDKRLNEEFRERQREKARKSALFKKLASESASEESSKSLRERLEMLLVQSGLDLTVRRFFLISVVAGFAGGLLAAVIWTNYVTISLGSLIGASLPLAFFAYKRRVRLEKLTSQLPDAFDLMARVVRAGQTVSQAILAVADEFDRPIAAEFAYCFEQQNLGLAPELALRDLAKRTGVLEIKVFVMALIVQQQTGGNLAELLDNLADIMRQRFVVRGKVRALTAEGRFQAVVLLALPPTLLAILFFINPGYVSILFTHSYLLIGLLISELIGALWIRKIVNFDF